MRFDDQAQDRFLAWYDGHMRTRVRTPEAEERPDHGFLSKGAGLVLRLTITLHLFRWTCGETASPGLVELASLEPAIGIFERYCVPMYDRVCKAFGEREAHEGAARLCDYIRKKKLDQAAGRRHHQAALAGHGRARCRAQGARSARRHRLAAAGRGAHQGQAVGQLAGQPEGAPMSRPGFRDFIRYGADKGGQRSAAAERRNSLES